MLRTYRALAGGVGQSSLSGASSNESSNRCCIIVFVEKGKSVYYCSVRAAAACAVLVRRSRCPVTTFCCLRGAVLRTRAHSD